MLNLKNDKFEYDPYPFGYFNEIFDRDFYNSLCDEFPSVNELKVSKDKKEYKLNKFKKFSLTNDHAEFKSLMKNKNNFSKLYKFLDSEEFILKLSEVLLKNHIDLKLRYSLKKFFIKKRNFNLFFEFSSIPCDGGFILPHTDAPKKIMTFVIPIIKSDDIEIEKFKKIGTSILAMSDNKLSYNYFNKTIRYEDTIEKKYVNFCRNNMLMFIKTHNSLHSVGPVEPLNDKIKFRNSLTFSLRKNEN